MKKIIDLAQLITGITFVIIAMTTFLLLIVLLIGCIFMFIEWDWSEMSNLIDSVLNWFVIRAVLIISSAILSVFYLSTK